MPRRLSYIGVVLLGLVLAFLGASRAGGVELLLAQAPPQVAVPPLTNRTPAEARDLLRPLGLDLRVVGQVLTANQALSGRVANQSPQAGARVSRGTAVQVRVYYLPASPPGLPQLPATPPGPPVAQPPAAQVMVPSLVNRTMAEVSNILGPLGLPFRVVGYTPTNNPALSIRVANQMPQAGARVNRGTAIQVQLYQFTPATPPGPPQPQPPAAQVTVPSVANRTTAEASNILRPLGLGFQVVGQTPTNNPALSGRVAGQMPQPGARVSRGTAVRVQVYQFAAGPTPRPGPPPGFRPPVLPPMGQVVVPSVVGRTTAEASNILRPLQLGLGLVGQVPTPDPGRVGRIASQTPAAGTRVGRGAAVQVQVFHLAATPPGPTPPGAPGAGEVLVPSLVGQNRATAISALAGRGLGYRQVGQEYTRNEAQLNSVAWQSPAPNTRVKRGSVVQFTTYIVLRPDEVLVPNLAGQPLEAARDALQRLGLTYAIRAYNPTQDRALDRKVSSQDQRPGVALRRGWRVMLDLYSYRPVQVRVPNLVNQRLADAQDALRKLGLGSRVVYIKAPGPRMANLVARMNPPPNTPVDGGTVVELTVWRLAP